jgi:peptidyl-prolyl cis-trans isomerase SurA
MRKLFVTLFLLSLLPWGTGAQNNQNGLIDKVVAVVGREMILLSEIESEVNMRWIQGVVTDKNIRCEVLESLLLQKLLLAQARIDSLKATDAMVDEQVDQQMRRITAQLGSEKAVEEYFRKPVFQLKKDLREPARERILTGQMQNSLMREIPVTPSEVEKAYRQIPKDSLPVIPAQYVLRQIVVYPPAGEAKFEVRERLLELRERITKGERFSTLAVLYSEDPSNAMRGGELGLRSYQEYTSAFAEAARILKPGQVSPIVETEFGYHLIEMIEKQGSDLFNARHILLKPAYTMADRQTAFTKLDSIAGIVRKGDMTFEQAARKLSQDTKSNINGGLIVNELNLSARFDKDQLNPADYGVLRDMKQGDISIPYESQDRMGNVQYKILLLEQLIPSHPASLQDDYNLVLQLTMRKQQEAALEKWVEKKQASTYIRIDPMYESCVFTRQGWKK